MPRSETITREECLKAVGEIISYAAFADMLMMLVFADILQSPHDGLARSIYYTFDSFSGKRSLLLRAAQTTGHYADPELRELIDALLAGCQRTNKQRSRVAHNLILGDEGDIDEIHGRNLASGSTRMRKKEMERRVSEAEKGFRDASRASRALWERRAKFQKAPP